MPERDEQQHRSPRDVPPVGRPRGAIWRSLQADGVVWEGQVLLVGDNVDLAARMIVTHRRVVFVRGGDLVLDVPRGWLRPEPVLRRDGVLELFVSMPGSDPFAEPMRVPLRMREGHPAAGHIIAMLAPGGVRRIAPDTLSGMERAREAAPAPKFGGFWDDIPAGESGLDDGDGDPYPNGPADASELDARDWTPLEPPDLVVRASSLPPRRPPLSAYPITGLLPRDQRKSSWGLLLRLGALTLLLATAAALGAGKLNIQIPGAASEAVLAVPTATAPAASSPAESPAAAMTTDDVPAVPSGVGGPAAQATATAEATVPARETTDPDTSKLAAPTKPAIPTPAPEDEARPTPPPSPTPTPAAELAAVVAPPSSQPAAVSAAEAPAQEIVVGPLRVAIANAVRDDSLPAYGLPPGTGEWVVVAAELTNEGDTPASLAMQDFRLFDRGAGRVADLDSGTDVIARLAGFDPARAAGDVIALEPGRSAAALLLYLLPPGSSDDLALLVGQSAMNLAPSLALGKTAAAAPPELVETTVTEVLDGGRLAVAIDGKTETVSYLGFAPPASGVCFAAEAAAANEELVAGKRVWLERQAADRGADGALLRDVWFEDADGNRVLVAARLLEAGAGELAVAAPDIRYQAWLAASAELARANGAGRWSACPEQAAGSDDAPRLAYAALGWRERWGFTLR